MRYFSVPADFNAKTIDAYANLNNTYKNSKVIETYGQITVNNFMESGRASDVLPPIDIFDLADYIKYSKQKGINFNYTMNAPTMKNREFTEKGVYEIKKFLNELYKVGVRELTVALPPLMEIIQSMGYDFKIKASVICQITTPNKAVSINKLGVERMVLDECLNRDFSVLKRIVNAVGDKVELIANGICHLDCTNRMFHYNQMSSDTVKVTSDSSCNYYAHRCMEKRCDKIGNIMKLSWIRPEDVKYYNAIGIKYFKLQGRQAVINGDLVRAVESYFKESYDGNLMELLDMFLPTNNFKVNLENKKLDGFIKRFYENEGFCKHDCTTCNYCDSYVKNCMDIEKTQEVIEMSNKFYKEYDQYRKLLSTVRVGDDKSKLENDMDIKFSIEDI
ncbi:U32 family peptidase [Clostridium estertheticum]|uniref:U32 family peptidase n=1 Tax=Clostridium estertheticum TaxID=238834 RepID=UPI001CF5AFFF|nr:U32 family peptidase [Clostridium estertheticum]MCB2354689.1 U32 family peptidase [Clostridium estertheticum]WAG40934.1 U32 family peptidase [Clostridium estertheticum]